MRQTVFEYIEVGYKKQEGMVQMAISAQKYLN